MAVDEIYFTDWQVGWSKDGSAVYAGIGKGAEGALMEECYFSSGSCQWVIGTKAPCTDGKTYPALANTDRGSTALTLICDGSNKKGNHRLVVSGKYALEKLIGGSAGLSIAIPIEGVQFKSLRFSLKGMIPARAKVQDDLQRKTKASPSKDPVTSSVF